MTVVVRRACDCEGIGLVALVRCVSPRRTVGADLPLIAVCAFSCNAEGHLIPIDDRRVFRLRRDLRRKRDAQYGRVAVDRAGFVRYSAAVLITVVVCRACDSEGIGLVALFRRVSPGRAVRTDLPLIAVCSFYCDAEGHLVSIDDRRVLRLRRDHRLQDHRQRDCIRGHGAGHVGYRTAVLHAVGLDGACHGKRIRVIARGGGIRPSLAVRALLPAVLVHFTRDLHAERGIFFLARRRIFRLCRNHRLGILMRTVFFRRHRCFCVQPFDRVDRVADINCCLSPGHKVVRAERAI